MAKLVMGDQNVGPKNVDKKLLNCFGGWLAGYFQFQFLLDPGVPCAMLGVPGVQCMGPDVS